MQGERGGVDGKARELAIEHLQKYCGRSYLVNSLQRGPLKKLIEICQLVYRGPVF
jgi:hypothetical protein